LIFLFTLHNSLQANRFHLFTSLPCTGNLTTNTIWTNQERFNHVNVSMETTYTSMEDIYYGDTYIRSYALGVVLNDAHILHTKVDRKCKFELLNYSIIHYFIYVLDYIYIGLACKNVVPPHTREYKMAITLNN